MYERLTEGDGPVLGYRIYARPLPEHVEEVVTEMKDRIRRHGEIRVLLQLSTAERPDLPTAWKELRHLSAELSDVRRIAIVGTRRHEHWYVRIFGALVPMPVRYFHARDLNRAWEWLRG